MISRKLQYLIFCLPLFVQILSNSELLRLKGIYVEFSFCPFVGLSWEKWLNFYHILIYDTRIMHASWKLHVVISYVPSNGIPGSSNLLVKLQLFREEVFL